MFNEQKSGLQPINPYSSDTYTLKNKYMIGNCIFDKSSSKIFYINIDEQVQRNESAIEQSTKLSYCLNVGYERVSAITPSNYEQFAYSNNLKHKSINDMLNLSEPVDNFHIRNHRNVYRHRSIACSMSHLKVILRAEELDLDYAIILEDDFMFHEDEFTTFMQSLNRLPSDFGILYLAGSITFSPTRTMRNLGYKFSGSYINDEFFKIKSGYLGSCGWILNMRNAKLVEYIKDVLQNGVFIDRFLAFDIQKKFDCYMSKYRVGYQSFLQESSISINANNHSGRIGDMQAFAVATPWSLETTRPRRYVEILK